MEIKKNIPLAEYTSWFIGGAADFFCMPNNEAEVKEAWQFALENELSITLLGGGTNVLVSDEGVSGLTICLRKFSSVSSHVKDGYIHIQCLAGTAKSELLKIFLKNKLEPALFLAGLPGDVGGGIVMNAGVSENMHPREFGEIVESFTVLKNINNKFIEETYTHDQIKWTYRHSYNWQEGIITRVTIKWPMRSDDEILAKVKNANKVRLSKQPLDMPSCGSVFINPEGYKAAQLVESCGLKGTRRGDAQVSLKHSNFIVNLGQASARDTWELIQFVKSTVKQKTGVDLKTEVIRLGRWDN